jgi:hypothetical protein
VESDGGGIRGLVTTILLQRITATPGLKDLLKSIDLVDLGKLRGADYQCNQFRVPVIIAWDQYSLQGLLFKWMVLK